MHEGPAHPFVRGLAGERAEDRHPGRRFVEAEGVRAAHRTPRTTVAALPDPPEPVDDEVVADVGPAQVVGVVAVDRPQQRRHLVAAVVVARRGVVHVDLLDRAVVVGPAVAPPLLGAPALAAADVRPRRLVRLVGLVGFRSTPPAVAVASFTVAPGSMSASFKSRTAPLTWTSTPVDRPTHQGCVERRPGIPSVPASGRS